MVKESQSHSCSDLSMHGQILFIKVIKKHIFCSLLSMPYFLRYFRLHHEQFVYVFVNALHIMKQVHADMKALS